MKSLVHRASSSPATSHEIHCSAFNSAWQLQAPSFTGGATQQSTDSAPLMPAPLRIRKKGPSGAAAGHPAEFVSQNQALIIRFR